MECVINNLGTIVVVVVVAVVVELSHSYSSIDGGLCLGMLIIQLLRAYAVIARSSFQNVSFEGVLEDKVHEIRYDEECIIRQY